jgi:uncharacterized membrane protein HdeD (DUF308 family)
MGDLTKMVIGAMVASPTFMVLAVIQPELALVLGIGLSLVGVITLIQAFREYDNFVEYVVGVLTLAFGITIEFATIEDLARLIVLAVVIDVAIGIVDKYF